MARFRPLSPGLSIFIALLLAGCSQQAQEPDPRTQAPLVIQSQVQPKGEQQRRFLGLISARVESPLSFRVGGKIDSRKVQNGERVVRGQPLMTLDPKDLQLDHRARLAAVQAAQAQAEQAQAELARMKLLVEQGAVSRQAYDQSRQANTSAQANLRSARAQAELSQNADRYSTLLAESDGVITAQLADTGQVVSPGQAVLRLAHDGPRDVLVDLPEHLKVPLGTQALITLPGQETKTYATLRELAQAADPATRSYQARFSLEQTQIQARLGSSAVLYLDIPDTQRLTQVPLGALHDAGQGPGVWVISNQQTLHWQAVRIDSLGQEYAYLSDGPQTGAAIVALGARLLHEGQKVRPQAQQAVVP
ncbi:efflux RND transporter periplasmic adaptor subunit [Alcaligenes sp. SDU_A2]|uniref:efflux RND transporter periplasmic adaptor subunit n=1 Tax=Alcaligenes sp. SDU_A2 TaxID=3136634 RepID=UPI00311F11DC